MINLFHRKWEVWLYVRDPETNDITRTELVSKYFLRTNARNDAWARNNMFGVLESIRPSPFGKQEYSVVEVV